MKFTKHKRTFHSETWSSENWCVYAEKYIPLHAPQEDEYMTLAVVLYADKRGWFTAGPSFRLYDGCINLRYILALHLMSKLSGIDDYPDAFEEVSAIVESIADKVGSTYGESCTVDLSKVSSLNETKDQPCPA